MRIESEEKREKKENMGREKTRGKGRKKNEGKEERRSEAESERDKPGEDNEGDIEKKRTTKQPKKTNS